MNHRLDARRGECSDARSHLDAVLGLLSDWDVADAAEYFASDLASCVSGQTLLISGGALQ